jgi:5-hydroxyisourate hydrolase-like protein (transthyretin family)
MKSSRSFPAPASRALFRGATLLLALATVSSLHAQDRDRGRKYKAPPPVAKITVTVLRASNGQPIQNAAVIFHTFHDGKDQGNMELKTDEDGKTTINVIPIGDMVQLQVFKVGFQTYGKDFTNDQADRAFVVKIKPPNGQYSIYQSAPVDSEHKQSVTPQPTESASKPESGPN